MITSLALTNYRNLLIPESEGIPLDRLTIFVGPNGFGKTNLIRVLRFLRDSWVGSVEETRRVTRFEDAAVRWGNSAILDASRVFPDEVSLDVEIALEKGHYIHGFSQGLRVSETSIEVEWECLTRRSPSRSKEEAFYYYDANIRQGINKVSVFADESRKSKYESRRSKLEVVGPLPRNEMAIHSIEKWLNQHSTVAPKDTPLYEGQRLIQDFLQGWAFYDSSQMSLDAVRRARQEVGLSDTILDASGENLPLVLFNLCKDINFSERLVAAMRQLFPDTRAIRPTVVGRVNLTVEWWLHAYERPFFLDQMSDGTLRMLCWAAVLLAPQPASLIVLDEPEASLHPAWLSILAGWIREAARKTQVIVSTHSADLLDYFTDDAAGVRVFERSPEDPSRVAIRALDPAKIADKLAEGWKLGDLYRVGDPEMGGWPW
jgi:predicted ATPase